MWVISYNISSVTKQESHRAINNSMAATTTAAAAASGIFGIRIQDPRPGTGRVQARLGFSFGKKKTAPPPKKSRQVQDDGDRLVWFPGANPPEWLDGSMIGDRGFDPFGLGKPAEYLQYDFDGLDQNLAKNVAGDVIGIIQDTSEIKPTPFQPYTEVFGIQRFRECELIHGRWAMLGTLGAIAVEALTGIAWQDAGKVHYLFVTVSHVVFHVDNRQSLEQEYKFLNCTKKKQKRHTN